MSFGKEVILTQDVTPNEPWDMLEANFFECIRRSMRAIEDGKRNVDSRGNKETRQSKKKLRREKRREDSRKSS